MSAATDAGASSGIAQPNKNQLKQRRKEIIQENVMPAVDDLKKVARNLAVHEHIDWIVSGALTVWTSYIRLWRISQPAAVVFDEGHFGSFASKYINKQFFVDVHPPFAKILITWASQLAGFNGFFEYKGVGQSFTEQNVPYVPVRIFCAWNGILLVPIAYWTMRGCKFSFAASVLTALTICYENSLIANNRLILLDSILLFFTATSVLSWVNFKNQSQKPFQNWWWAWLALTGAALGLTVSSKWVGLFTIATIGVSVLNELWKFWGDQKMTKTNFAQHFLARAGCLLVLPTLIYLTCFKIHFSMLSNTGPGAIFMSPEFQATLDNAPFPEMTPADVTYGAHINLRHFATTGGYLHSHKSFYPGGSKQQQITLYAHDDPNNWWAIYKADTEEIHGVEYVKDGDLVRLTHLITGKRLHTHDVRPTTSDEKYHFEASAYGDREFEGDSNDHWRVEIIQEENGDAASTERLRARRSRFRLVSPNHNCALFSHNKRLPSWGFNQQEVTCMKDAKADKVIWRIESTKSNLLSSPETVGYKHAGFFAKFKELNTAMWNINQGLSTYHEQGSRPNDWPTLRRGMSFFDKDYIKIFLIGNPLIYWASAISVAVYVVFKLITLLVIQRGVQVTHTELNRFDGAAGLFVIGWAMHYFPFNLMHRQLFLHHYMPSLYMAILSAGSLFEVLTVYCVPRVRWSMVGIAMLSIIYVYRTFIPITYAQPWTEEKCLSATWRSTWNFGCRLYTEQPEKLLYTDGSKMIVEKRILVDQDEYRLHQHEDELALQEAQRRQEAGEANEDEVLLTKTVVVHVAGNPPPEQETVIVRAAGTYVETETVVVYVDGEGPAPQRIETVYANGPPPAEDDPAESVVYLDEEQDDSVETIVVHGDEGREDYDHIETVVVYADGPPPEEVQYKETVIIYDEEREVYDHTETFVVYADGPPPQDEQQTVIVYEDEAPVAHIEEEPPLAEPAHMDEESVLAEPAHIGEEAVPVDLPPHADKETSPVEPTEPEPLE